MGFKYSRRIYLGDTDAAGVVYFARGIEICHEAYEESLTAAGISLQQTISEREIALPIVRAEIDFLRPLFCGDRIIIDLTTNLVSSTEFTVSYQIFNAANPNQLVIKATTQHVCINPNLRSRVDLLPAMLDWLENHRDIEKP